MKTIAQVAFFSAAALFIATGCANPTIVLSSAGDSVLVVLTDRTNMHGELLSVQNSSLYVLEKSTDIGEGGTIVRIPFEDTRSIRIFGYTERTWYPSLIMVQTGAAGLMAIAAASRSGGNFLPVFGFFLVPMGVSVLLLELSESRPGEYAPFSESEIAELRTYCRFPTGMSDDMIRGMLERRGQDSVQEKRSGEVE